MSDTRDKMDTEGIVILNLFDCKYENPSASITAGYAGWESLEALVQKVKFPEEQKRG